MKKLTITYILSALAMCAARWADLALWTDLETGLLQSGSVWLRYFMLAVFAAGALAVGAYTAGPPEALRCRRLPAAVPALMAVLLYLWQAALDLMQGGAALLSGALTLLCAAWLGRLALGWLRDGQGTPPALLGVGGSLLFVWGVLNDFMTNGSSWQRTVPTSAVWQQLAALLFLSALARAFCLPGTSDGRALSASGLLAFCLCLCWHWPRCFLMSAGPGDWALCWVGLLGGVCAVLSARPEGGSRGAHAAG